MATDADKSVVANAIIPSIIQFLVMHPEKSITSKNFAEIVEGIEEERLLESYATYQFVQAPKELAGKYKMIKFVNKSRGGGSNVRAFFSYFDQYKNLFSIVPNGDTILDAVPYLAKIDGSYFMKVYSAVQKIGQFMGDEKGLRVVETMFDSTHKGESSLDYGYGYSPAASGDYTIEKVPSPVNVRESPEYKSVVVEKERLQNELKKLQEKYGTLEETAKKMEEENRQYSEENEATQELLTKEREKVATAHKEVAVVEKSKKSETQALRENLGFSEKKLASLEEEKESQRQRLEELERVIRELEESAKKKDAKIKELTEQLEAVRKHGDVEALVEENSAKSKKIIELEDMVEEKSVLLKAKEKDLEIIAGQIRELEEKEERMQNQVQDLEKTVQEKSSELEKERSSKEEAVSTNVELEKKLEKMKDNEVKIREVMEKNADTLAHTLRQQGRLKRSLAQSQKKIEQLEESKK